MDRTFAATVVAAVLLLAAGIGAGVYVGGTGVFDQSPRVDPALTGFTAENATCVDGPAANTTVQRATDDAGSTFLTVRRNVTVPDAAHTLNASFQRVELANYSLSLRSVPTGVAADPCPGEAVPRVAFTATVQVPHSFNETYGVTVVHDGDRVARIRNAPGTFTVREANRSA